MQPWLFGHLVDTGVLNPGAPRNGLEAKTCHRCAQRYLSAVDCGVMPVRLDPAPLTALGELLALQAGRTTYAVTVRAGRFEVAYRGPEEVAGWPPGAQLMTDVVADHACRSSWPDGATTTTATKTATDGTEPEGTR